LSFRDTDTTAGQLTSAVSMAGIAVRYAFYFFGMIVFGIIALALIWQWHNRTRIIDDKPAFRIADGSIARLPVSTDIVSRASKARIDILRYGTLQNRTTDLALAITFPSRGSGMTSPGMGVLSNGLLTDLNFRTLAGHFDLETRYGPYHAVEMRIEADGRWKQCLAFSSRFDTNVVFVAGWTCDATGTKPGADALACALDKLVIDKELPTKEADAYLRERMTRPAFCSSRQVSQTFDTGSRPISPPSRWSQPSARTRI